MSTCPRAADVIADMVAVRCLRDTDLALERKVVLEEISIVEDTPGRPGLRAAQRALWPPAPLRLLDSRHAATPSRARRPDLQALHQRAYHRGNS